MAKLKSDNQNNEIQEPEATTTEQPDTPKAAAQPVSGSIGNEPTPPEVKESELPPIAKKTLQIYTQYASLYIDNHGGAYTTNTKECIRGNATLYNNPYNN